MAFNGAVVVAILDEPPCDTDKIKKQMGRIKVEMNRIQVEMDRIQVEMNRIRISLEKKPYSTKSGTEQNFRIRNPE